MITYQGLRKAFWRVAMIKLVLFLSACGLANPTPSGSIPDWPATQVGITATHAAIQTMIAGQNVTATSLANGQETLEAAKATATAIKVINQQKLADARATGTAIMATATAQASSTQVPATETPDAIGTAVQGTLQAMASQNTATPAPTTALSNTQMVTSTSPMTFTLTVSGTVQTPVTETVHGAWTFFEYARLGDNPIIAAWMERLKDPAPAIWKTYPNVPNKDVPEFRVVNGDQVPDGVEYGVPNVPFCQQDTRCDFVVPGWHYRLITADYKFLGMECTNNDPANRHGCLLLLINEGNETQIWRDQNADNGFTVPGRYWNGDALEWAVWGLVSNTSANMLNMETYGLLSEVLNAGPNGANAGANCGVQPVACQVVDVTVVVHTGDAIVAVLKTTVVHP